MTEKFDSKEQVKRVFSSTHILPDLLNTILTLSSQTQLEYMNFLEELVGKFREILDGQIRRLSVDHKSTWQRVNKQKFGFIDGGVASINSLGSDPIAVRVGRYSVKPGVEGNERESFTYKTQLVDELYDLSSNEAIFEEFSDNQGKLRDMARIASEAGAIFRSLIDENDFEYLYIHGPLINPVAPYADYPNFTQKMLDVLGIEEKEVMELIQTRLPFGNEKHFISIYFYILNYIFHSQTPVLGVIERNTGSKMIALTILDKLEEENSIQAKEAKLWKARMGEYKITDAILFACLLQEGEYIDPLYIDKNGLHKAPEFWKPIIRDYPKPLTTYLKVSESSFPFRIEMFPANKDPDLLLSVTYHMARLLPQYGFPVGLDIVDKYAKVPAWMTNQLTKEQSINLLRNAINSGKPDVVDLVKLYLAGNHREWFLRPKSN